MTDVRTDSAARKLLEAVDEMLGAAGVRGDVDLVLTVEDGGIRRG